MLDTDRYTITDRTQGAPDVPTAPPPQPPDAPGPRPPERRGPRTVVTVLVAALVAGLTSYGVTLAARPEPSPTVATSTAAPRGDAAAANGGALSIAEVAAAAAPSVASVEVTSARGQGEGSAVIYREDGYLLTNDHVVADATDVRVQLADGTRYEAEVVGTDPTSDLAVLSVDAEGLPAARFADDGPVIGATVVAIGSPFGLEGSVSSGIVSALDRSLAGSGSTLTGLIQTDAAINPGNSGGALVDDLGRVVGINTAIISRGGANDGIGFAVPATTATAVADQLIERGSVEWAVLGVAGQDVDERVARAYGLSVEAGALVVRVEPGGAAELAGIRDGDIVVAFDGTPVDSMSALAGAVRAHQPGDEVELEVVRDGGTLTLSARLGATP